MINELWKSNESLHERFLGKPANLMQSLYAYGEESKEFDEAAQSGSDWHAALEAADVLYTIIGVCRSRGIDVEMFLDACQHVINKNDAKTLETHYINEFGKIQRKGRE